MEITNIMRVIIAVYFITIIHIFCPWQYSLVFWLLIIILAIIEYNFEEEQIQIWETKK